MDARAALDAIYDYVTTKRDADMMSSFDEDAIENPELQVIADRFDAALNS